MRSRKCATAANPRAAGDAERAPKHSRQIDGGERGELDIFERSPLAAVPEILHARDREALRARIPQAKMQLQRGRMFGIEIVAAPFPAGFADQRGQVIHGMSIPCRAKVRNQAPRATSRAALNLLAREQQIQIVLRAKARIVPRKRGRE